jgi:DNA gyrase subunit B
VLHAGGKFGDGGYKVSGGLHGVGVSVVNALSDDLRAEVRREKKLWRQDYKRGKPVTKVKPVGKATDTGTTIEFHPDPQIYETLTFDWTTILDHLRQQAYLTKGVTIRARDGRNPKDPQVYFFHFEGGVHSYVRHLNFHLSTARSNKTRRFTSTRARGTPRWKSHSSIPRISTRPSMRSRTTS